MSALRFRQYADDCRRSAEKLPPDQRPKMLEMAKAWEACAEMIEDEEKKDDEPEPARASIAGQFNRDVRKKFGGGGAASAPRDRRHNERRQAAFLRLSGNFSLPYRRRIAALSKRASSTCK